MNCCTFGDGLPFVITQIGLVIGGSRVQRISEEFMLTGMMPTPPGSDGDQVCDASVALDLAECSAATGWPSRATLVNWAFCPFVSVAQTDFYVQIVPADLFPVADLAGEDVFSCSLESLFTGLLR